jgi:hypothetical protein
MSRILPSSRRHCRSTAPSAPPPSSFAAPCFPWPSDRPYPFPRPYRTFTCHLLSRSGPYRRRSRAAAAPPPVFAVRPRRRVSRPNSGHPQALGEHMVMPHHFPGREHGRLAGIRPVPPPSHGRGPDCKPPSSFRVFSVNQGCFREVSNLFRGLSAKE